MTNQASAWQEELPHKLKTIVAKVLAIGEDELSGASNAHNTRNWDSMRHVELILAVEIAFNVRFSMPEIAGLQNLGEMCDVLASKGAEFQ